MKNLTVIDHPLLKRDLTVLRDKRTSNHMFRSTLRRISSIMAYQVTQDLKMKQVTVTTPLQKTKGFVLGQNIVLVPVLRAGIGLVDGFLDFLPESKVGHVGLYRDEKTLKPVEYYSKFPKNLSKSVVFLLDPMLATGGSGSAAILFLKEKGARNIRFVSLLAAPQGVRKISARHPDVQIYTAVLDRTLNKHGYILPGLGDAGDRIFGTE